MAKNIRMKLVEEVMEYIGYLLEQQQTIPISEDENETVHQMISKEGGTYLLFERGEVEGEFDIQSISKDDAVALLHEHFEKESLEGLKEVVMYWQGCAAAFKEEEEKGNVMFALPKY